MAVSAEHWVAVKNVLIAVNTAVTMVLVDLMGIGKSADTQVGTSHLGPPTHS